MVIKTEKKANSKIQILLASSKPENDQKVIAGNREQKVCK